MFYQNNPEIQIIRNSRISYETHIHSEIEIIAVFKGKAKLLFNGAVYCIEVGDIVIIPPNTVHGYSSEHNIDVGKFIFNPLIVNDIAKYTEKSLMYPIVKDRKILDLCNEIICTKDTYSDNVKRAYLNLLTILLTESCAFTDRKSVESGMVSFILDYCQKNYTDNITLDSVAANVHISKSYVSHIFANNIKMNFRDYLNSLRISKALKLLRQDANLPITEISQQCGFQSIRTFNRAFKSVTGHTPKAYRLSFKLNTKAGQI